jgi:phage regulator Rha-like protein
MSKNPEPLERIIKSRIFTIRGVKVILDSDLADLYSVETKRLNEQVKRNIERFPDEFMFQLSENEFSALRSQIATSKSGKGGRRYMPFVFTEHGALMAANIIRSDQAIKMSIQIIKAFVQMRQLLDEKNQIAQKLDELEERLDTHDTHLAGILSTMRALMETVQKPPVNIGFLKDEKGK